MAAEAIQYTENTGLTLAPTSPEEQPPVTLAPPTAAMASPPSMDVATNKAKRAFYGSAGDLGESQESILNRFVQGEEDNIRKQVALSMDYKQRTKQMFDLRDYTSKAARAGRSLDTDTIDYLTRYKQNDPNVVLEENYTKNSLSALNTASTAMPGTVWTDALKDIPAQVSQADSQASDYGTKQQMLQNWLDNAKDARSKQTWPGVIFDELKQFSQIYPEVKMRNNVPGADFGLGLSSAVKGQADKGFRMSNSDFFKTFDPVIKKMINDNPGLAEAYINKLQGESQKEQFIGNLFTLAAIPDFIAGGAVLKGLGKKIFHARAVDKAYQDVLKEASKVNATPASIKAASGDLAGSAVDTVAENSARQVSPTIRTMLEMTDNFPKDIAKIPEGTADSSAAREIATRVQSTLSGDTQLIGPTIVTMNRVNRTGYALTDPENVKAVEASIRSDFRGPWASLLNVKVDPERNAFTNTHDYILELANPNGQYFRHPETARNYARDNGWGEARIVQGTGPLESETNQATKLRLDQTRKDIGTLQTKAEEYRALLKDKSISKEDKATARGAAKKLNDRITELNDRANRLEISLTAEGNPARRTTQIKAEIARLRADVELNKLFPKETKAKIAALAQESRAINYGLASPIERAPVIRQQGVGYYIELRRPLDETMPVMRDLMIKDLQNRTRREAVANTGSWINALVGKFRSPEDTMSLLENQQRKTAVYSQAILDRLGDNLGRYIEDLSRGRVRFDSQGNLVPWYFAVPRNVLGVPYRFAKDVAGTILNRNGEVRINSRKQMFSEWEQTVDYARRAKGPDGKPGYYFQNAGELNDYYLRKWSRMPTHAETLAYFAKVELDEYNRVLTNIAVYRNKARLGTMSHQIVLTDGTSRTLSASFDGVQRKEFPGGEGNIVVFDNSSGKPSKVYTLEGNHIPNKQREMWKEAVANGRLKVIELWDPESRPLANFGNIENQRVRYALVDSVESNPISYNQVNRRGGGHFDYEYEHYLKQAIIRNDNVGNRAVANYEGDMTVMALANRAMGRDIAENMDTVRQLIKEGRIDEARDFTRAKLSMEFDGDDGLHAWFKPGRDKNGNVTAPRLNLDEKFHVVPKGKSIVNLDAELESRLTAQGYTFRNGTNSGSLARQFQVNYTKERDAYDLIAPDNIGTVKNPLYKYEPAKLVDAMPTLQRALNQAIKSTLMDDYKIFAVENWLRQAETHLKEGPDAVRSSPFYHFHNPVWRDGTPREVEKNLEYNRQKIIQFIGVPSEFDTTIHALSQKLADAAYESGVSVRKLKDPKLSDVIDRNSLSSFPAISLKDTAIIPLWLLNRVHDPITKLRSLTYNAKLGLFNIPQLLVQAQTHANIWALAGRNGGAGTYASLLHVWSNFGDDSFLRHLDSYASKIGFAGKSWKPGEFYEARKLLGNTGFEHVAGEYAVLDQAFNKPLIGGDFNAFLSLGQQFFKQGEKFTRTSAWYTAYKEFRDLKPTGLITQEDTAKILQRADLLTVNMSRASSSALHTGVLSLTTQFLSYQLRLAELFIGSRTTKMEKLRLFGVYGGLYGLPAAFGLTGFPISNDIRSAAIDHLGYYPGKDWISSLLVEGIPSLVTALVTGEIDKDGHITGNFYNIGDRYGAQGFTQVREALRSDVAWWKILGGAGVTTLVNTVVNADGFTKAMYSYLFDPRSDRRFQLQMDDIVDVAKEISSVNSTWRLITALNVGRWYTKNESYITPVTPANALFMTLTGLSPQEQNDLYTKGNLIKSREGMYKYAESKFIQEVRRGIAAKQNNQKEEADMYLRRATAYLEAAGFPNEMKAAAAAKASKGWESRIDQADFSFYLRNVPEDKKEAYRQTFKDLKRMKEQ